MSAEYAHPSARPAIPSRAGLSRCPPNCRARIEKRRTAGTYVSDQKSPLARRERVRLVTERADALLVEARQMDIGLDEVIDILRHRDTAMHPVNSGAAS